MPRCLLRRIKSIDGMLKNLPAYYVQRSQAIGERMTEGDVKYLVIDAEKIHKEKMLVLEELDSQTANRKANLLLSIQIKRNSIQILEESLNKMGQDWRGSEDAYKKKAALVEEVKVLDKEFFSYKGNETIYSIHLSMALDGKYERGKVLDAIPEGAKILI